MKISISSDDDFLSDYSESSDSSSRPMSGGNKPKSGSSEMSNDSDDGAKLTAVESNSSNKPKEVKDRPEQRKSRGSTCSKGKQSRFRSKHDNGLGVKGGMV